MNRVAVLSQQVRPRTQNASASVGVAAEVTAANEVYYEDTKTTMPNVTAPKTKSFITEVDARTLDFESCRRTLQGKSSVIIIHGCTLDDCKGVDAFAQKILDMPLMSTYPLGAAPRDKLQGNTWAASYADWNVPLSPHTEMSYAIERPSVLAFSCVKKGKYGQTFVIDTVGVLDEVQQRPNLRRYFASGRLRLDRTFLASYKWERYYGSKEDAVAHMKKQGYKVTEDGDKVHVSFSFNHSERDAKGDRCSGFLGSFGRDNSLILQQFMQRMMYKVSAAKELKLDLADYLGNSSRTDGMGGNDGNDYVQTFLDSDGRDLVMTAEDGEELAEVARQHMELVQWKEGDIVLIDNKRVMHGRLPRDPQVERDVRVALFLPYQVQPL